MSFCRCFSLRRFRRTSSSPWAIPYFSVPSASPTSFQSSQYMSTYADVPSESMNSFCNCGIGNPARLIETRLTDSRTDSARASANATTARARAIPTRPEAASSSRVSSSGVHIFRRRASSAAQTAPVNGLVRATSTIVLAGDVTGIPSTSITASVRSRLWQIEFSRRQLPLPGRCLVVVTWRMSRSWAGSPCSTRAEVCDIAVPVSMCPATARDRISRRASSRSGPVGSSDFNA